jgi:type IV pilus assembly protein PilY1
VGQVCAQIILGSDDAGLDFNCIFSTTYNEVYFGSCSTGQNITSGFRFQHITIPNGALIQNAYIVFTVDGPYANPITVQLDGELNPNAPTYSASDQPTDPSRILTGSPVTWSITDTWNLGEIRNTPDLSPIIQQIVNQSSWASGNPISIIVKNVTPGNTHRRVIAFERTLFDPNVHTAILVVTYTP